MSTISQTTGAIPVAQKEIDRVREGDQRQAVPPSGKVRRIFSESDQISIRRRAPKREEEVEEDPIASWKGPAPSLEEAEGLVRKVTSSPPEDLMSLGSDLPPSSVAQLLI